ncbi:hypothetical protein V1520DRAFT_365995 [Lipomyces starkeyi]
MSSCSPSSIATNSSSSQPDMIQDTQPMMLEWCDERQFVDGQLATEQKLIAFLQTELIDKGYRNRERPYMANTLKLHVAATMDFWKQQVDFGLNPHSNPRTTNVQAI